MRKSKMRMVFQGKGVRKYALNPEKGKRRSKTALKSKYYPLSHVF